MAGGEGVRKSKGKPLHFANYSQNFIAGFVKPTLYDNFSYILFNIGAIKHIVEKKFKTCLIFYATV